MGIQSFNTSATTNINMKAFIAFSALLAVAFAAGPPAPYHPAPAYGKAPAYADVPPVYGFEYAVADDYSKANFGANEARDGYKTTGSYRVALPDGRTQVVTYRVDDAYSGYVADVSYEGHAAYPPAPVHKPAYKPAPVYHPAPVKPVHA